MNWCIIQQLKSDNISTLTARKGAIIKIAQEKHSKKPHITEGVCVRTCVLTRTLSIIKAYADIIVKKTIRFNNNTQIINCKRVLTLARIKKKFKQCQLQQ